MQPSSASGPHTAQQNAEIHAEAPRTPTSPAEQELDQMLTRMEVLAESLPAERLREAAASMLRLADAAVDAADDSPAQPLRLLFNEPAQPADDQEDRGSVGSLEDEEHPAAGDGDEADEAEPPQPAGTLFVPRVLGDTEHSVCSSALPVPRTCLTLAPRHPPPLARRACVRPASRAPRVNAAPSSCDLWPPRASGPSGGGGAATGAGRAAAAA